MPTTYFDPTNSLHELGIAVPAKLEDAHAAWSVVSDLANDVPAEVTPATSTPATVAADIRAHVERKAVQSYAREVLPMFARQARDLSLELYRADAPRIIKDLRASTTPRLKVLTKAAEHIGPDDTAETVIERDKAAVDTWRKRDELEDVAGELWSAAYLTSMLAEVFRLTKADIPDPLWWINVTDHNQLARIKANEWDYSRHVDRFLALMRGGHTVALATPEEAQARADAVARSREAEAARPFQDRLAAQNERDRRKGEALIAAHERLMVRE